MSRTQAQWVYREALLLARHFRVVDYDEEDGSWVHIRRFPLPAGWDRPATELLLALPHGYPHLPPDGFYIDRGLRNRLGQKIDHYFEDDGRFNAYAHRGWGWFCIHPHRGAWRPAADLVSGDNLLKLTALIGAILAEVAAVQGRR